MQSAPRKNCRTNSFERELRNRLVRSIARSNELIKNHIFCSLSPSRAAAVFVGLVSGACLFAFADRSDAVLLRFSIAIHLQGLTGQCNRPNSSRSFRIGMISMEESASFSLSKTPNIISFLQTKILLFDLISLNFGWRRAVIHVSENRAHTWAWHEHDSVEMVIS